VRAGGRRIPLVLSFGAVSLALTLGLGFVLSLMIDRTVNEHSIRALKNTTVSSVAVASQLIITDAGPTAAWCCGWRSTSPLDACWTRDSSRKSDGCFRRRACPRSGWNSS
jgi:hypothetical protein